MLQSSISTRAHLRCCRRRRLAVAVVAGVAGVAGLTSALSWDPRQHLESLVEDPLLLASCCKAVQGPGNGLKPQGMESQLS